MSSISISNTWKITLILIIILAILPQLSFGTYSIFVIFLFFIYLTMANMWNMLAGYTGLICLGQASFIGVAGYTVGIFILAGFSPYLVIVVGGIVAAGLSALIAIPTFRMKGIFFSIGTLVVSEAFRTFFTLFKPIEGPIWGGAGIPIRTNITLAELYYLALAICFISTILLKFILNSKIGLGLMAIRDNEISASSCGVPIFRCKLYSFVISSFLTGMAAGIFYLFQGHIEPVSAFGISWTMLLMIAVIIGGIGTLEGPIIGSALAVFFQQVLARYVGISLIIEGIIILMIMLIMPKGIVGVLRKILAAAGGYKRP